MIAPVAAGLAMAAQLLAQGAAPTRLTLAGPAPRVTTEQQLRAFLDDLESQQFAIGTALALESYYQWKGEATHRVAQDSRLSNDLLNRRDYAAIVDAWNGKVTDSTLARRVFLHHRAYLQARADPALVLALSDLATAIQDSIDRFRFTLEGKQLTETESDEIVDTTHDRARRRAAFVTGPQRTRVIGAMVRRAMQMYDSVGRQEGFETGADAGLALSSLTRAEVLKDLDAFELATRPAYLAMLERVRRDLNIDRVEPWDIDFWLNEQEKAVADAYPKSEGVSRLRTLFTDMGFRVDSLPIDVRVWDVPVGGITFPTRPPFEARLLTNPFTGSNFYETLFHEYGHALNTVLLRPDLSPILMNLDETPLSEGTAETLGHFAYDHDWLIRAAGISAQKANALERVGKMQLLLWLRRTVCMHAWVEVNAYANLNADLNSAYQEAYRRFVGVSLPDGDYFGNVDLYATGPLYFDSYLYANMVAAQFRAAMRSAFGVEDLTREPR
jgi:peptidyl-dipeptidase A